VQQKKRAMAVMLNIPAAAFFIIFFFIIF